MYDGFLQCLAFAGFGLALPAVIDYDSSQSVDLNSPFEGFPAEYLPLDDSLPEYKIIYSPLSQIVVPAGPALRYGKLLRVTW